MKPDQQTPMTYQEQIEKAGNPAFPVSIPGTGDNGWHGMLLRDWFAGQAIAGVLATNDDFESIDWNGMAEYAYDAADAMLKARGRTE